MLYWLSEWDGAFGPLRLFESITFRGLLAAGLAFLLALWLGPRFIRFMLRSNGVEDIDKPDSATLHGLHAGKKGTPTMGGVVLVAAVSVAWLLTGNWHNPLVWIGQGTLVGFAALGFLDDYAKMRNWGGKRGLTKSQKLVLQSVLAAAVVGVMAYAAEHGGFTVVDAKRPDREALARAGATGLDSPLYAAMTMTPDIYYTALRQSGRDDGKAAERGSAEAAVPAAADPSGAGEGGGRPAATNMPATRLVIPFTKWESVRPDLGWGYWVFAALVIVACSNAVNLTDGLDGLATGCSLMVAVAYTILAYVVGNVVICQFFRIPHVEQAGELAVGGAALAGGLMGFLWFNAHPARMFMGDTGSLALGALVGFLAVATKHEIVLILAGGVFVLEAGSVVVQVAGFKATGKRLFRCAPFHHHLEFIGWKENHVVVRLWVVGAMLAALALGTLKMH